jgi:hypothetical protein
LLEESDGRIGFKRIGSGLSGVEDIAELVGDSPTGRRNAPPTSSPSGEAASKTAIQSPANLMI